VNREQSKKATTAISVLYVDDDHQGRDLLLSLLVQKYPEQRFFSADNGLQGLERFRALRPAIVITDISMPVMDGISMAAEIKQLAPESIVIALTAHSETDRLLRAIEIGINYYVLKPLDFALFCTVVDKAITTVNKEQQLRHQYEQIIALNDTLAARTRELEAVNCELDAFNYTVAHDLRSPLASIGGFAQYLLEKSTEALHLQYSEYLQVICKETLRMNNLIDALLNLSSCSRQNIEKQWTNLSAIADNAICSLQLLEPERNVTFKMAADVQSFADPVLSVVVMENLLGNAWKFTAHQDAACIEFGVTTIDEKQVNYVRDNGTGFDQQEAVSLFTPFKRLLNEKEFKGFGIGLATVQRIMQRHGGKIWAEGEKGRGATFYFYF
jgi:two-component system, sensor histidine kinase and response regulator